MGEGFEVLLWLAVMGFIGIRGAMRNRTRTAARTDETEDERVVEHARQVEAARRVARSSSREEEVERSVPARRGGGVLSRWTEFAAELERQMKEQQEAQRTRQGSFEEEETVVVPGRRVYPSTPTAPGGAGAVSEASHWDDWETQPESHSLHSRQASDPSGRGLHRPAPRDARPSREMSKAQTVERIHRPGLARLEKFGALKRAVILADVLGPPPGLDGLSPAERRLDQRR